MQKQSLSQVRRLLFPLTVVASLMLSVAGDRQILQLGPSVAEARERAPRARVNPKLRKVCPTIREPGAWMFYKNNKPIRSSSKFDAPVIGFNRVMTFAYQKGYSGPLPGVSNMFAANGEKITTLSFWSCRSDHCGGRVVSSMLTSHARRRAIQLSGKPEGYVQLSNKSCAKIFDIGQCINAKVRGPCAGVEK